jgi:hypothetical protein
VKNYQGDCYEDQSPIVVVCSSHVRVPVGFRRNRQRLLRRTCLLRWWQLLQLGISKAEGPPSGGPSAFTESF